MKKIRILSNYELSLDQRQSFEDCQNGCDQDAEFIFEGIGSFDLICVLNTVSAPHVLRAPRNGIIKIVQEPFVRNSIFHRFVNHHGRKYSKVFGHREARPSGSYATRFIEHAPLLFPQVSEYFGPTGQGVEKSETLSIVASRIGYLAGHHLRNEFIESVHKYNPGLEAHTFGRGRNEILRKEEALDPYMYSLAVENSQIPSYITEKFLDCILRLTVPVYFGAQNVEECFPSGSVVQLKSLSESAAKEVLLGLSKDDYLKRLPALVEARDSYLRNMKLCCLVSKEAGLLKPLQERRFVFLPPAGEVIKSVMKLVRS